MIQDLQAPGTSKAFDTFFKDAANKDFVTTLFNNVAAGAPVYSPTNPPQVWQPYSPKGSPIILVIQQLGQWQGKIEGVGVRDAFTWCGENPSLTAHVAFGVDKYPIILLCPFFFDAQPPSIYGNTPPASVDKQPASNCLTVNAITNRFRKTSGRLVRQPTGFTLTQYRSWILLEELAHLYYQAAKGVSRLDEYNVNKCTKLSPQDALANGPTYSYYAASKCSRSPTGPSNFLCPLSSPHHDNREPNTNDSVLLPAVAGNCVDFPFKHKGVELLEVDGDPNQDPEELADYEDDDPMYEYAVTIDATEIQLDPSTPVVDSPFTRSPGKVPHCNPGTCYTWCICA